MADVSELREPREIVLLGKARLALAEAKSLDEIKEIRSQADAMRHYIRQRDDSLEAQNMAAEIKIRAERRAGEMLRSMPKNEGKLLKGTRPRCTDVIADPPTLSDLGISLRQSSNWQRIASITEADFERYIARTKDEEMELTTSGVLRLARGRERDAPDPAPDFDEDAQWAEDEKKLRARYRAWPEDQRGYFVLKVLVFANKLRHLNHPDVEFVAGGPMIFEESDR